MSEHERELWEAKLKPGEKLLWTGRPQELKMIDPANSMATYIAFGFAVVWAAVTLAIFASRISGAFALVIMELPAIIGVLIPFMDIRSIRNTEYAITDRRVIVKSGNDDTSMEYDSSTKVEKRANQTVCVGAATEIKPSRERHFLLFHGIQDDEKKVLGLVLYTTSDADRAVEILKGRQ